MRWLHGTPSTGVCQPCGEVRERPLAGRQLPFVAAFGGVSSGGMMPNVMFDGCVVARIGVRHVVAQRADGGRPRRGNRPAGRAQSGRRSAGDQTRRRGLDIALRRPTPVRRKNRSGRLRVCHVSSSTVGAVDVRVAMDHPEAHELGRFKAGNHPQHARLFAPLQLRLKPDEAVVIAGESVLPQLDDGIGPAARPRIGEPGGLHRPKPQRVDAAMRHHLDGQTPLEELRVVEVVHAAFSAETMRLRETAGIRPRSKGQFR